MALGVAAVVTAASCADEDPTTVGGGLVGNHAQTFDLVLDPAEFLVSDTTYDSLGSLNEASFRMAAHEFAGSLEAHTLFLVRRPRSISYTDASNVTHTDTLPALGGAKLTVVMDTIASTAGPVDLQVVQLTESWDPSSVSWGLRYDTASVSQPWATPGGTTGDVLADTTWESGDTLVIQLDSAAAQAWSDTTADGLGGMLRSTTPGARVFIRSMTLTFDVLPTQGDTVLSGGNIAGQALVAAPDAPPPGPGELRLGGLPTWRSLLRFLPIADLPVPCSITSTTCTVPLSEVKINAAVLQLQPIPVGARLLERPILAQGSAVLGAPGVPITRSPLSGALGITRDSLRADLFDGSSASPPRVTVPVTTFVQNLANATSDSTAVPWLALTQFGEGSSFGYAAFAAIASGNGPRLRLIVTVPESKVAP